MVRSFGGKTGLIQELCAVSLAHIEDLFRTSLPLTDENRRGEFADRFREIAFGTDEMRLFGQLFVCGHDEQLGRFAREGFERVCTLLHDELGAGLEQTRSIMANGMLTTILALLDYPQPAGPVIDYLITGQEPGRA